MFALMFAVFFLLQGHEDDSSPGMSTDADSEDPYCDTESPTPTNSAVNLDPKSYWQGTEEHRELLATEGEEDEDDDAEPEPESDKRDIDLVEIDSTDSDFGTSNNPTSDSDRGNHSGSDEGALHHVLLLAKLTTTLFRH